MLPVVVAVVAVKFVVGRDGKNLSSTIGGGLIGTEIAMVSNGVQRRR